MSQKPKLSKAQTDAIKAGILNHHDQGSATDRMATESQDGMSKEKDSGASGAAPDDSEPKVGYKNPPKDTASNPANLAIRMDGPGGTGQVADVTGRLIDRPICCPRMRCSWKKGAV